MSRVRVVRRRKRKQSIPYDHTSIDDDDDGVSSNYTASNNVGPGRSLGNLYSFLGRKIEKRVNKNPAGTAVAEDSLVLYEAHSSNYTASNIAGPGRLLGLFYGKIGRRIERGIGNFADRLGFGPVATFWKITGLSMAHQGDLVSVEAQISDLTQKLLRYTYSRTELTQFYALDLIVALSLERIGAIGLDKLIREQLRKSGAEITLNTVRRSIEAGICGRMTASDRELLSKAQQALLAAEGRDLDKLGEIITQRLTVVDDDEDDDDGDWVTDDEENEADDDIDFGSNSSESDESIDDESMRAWKGAFTELLEYLRYPVYAGMALNCFTNWTDDLWNMNFDVLLALEFCKALTAMLSNREDFEEYSLMINTDAIYEYLTLYLDFLYPYCEGEALEDMVKFEDTTLHIPSVLDILSNLREAYMSREFENSGELQDLPKPTWPNWSDFSLDDFLTLDLCSYV